jgi:hypothetical protein
MKNVIRCYLDDIRSKIVLSEMINSVKIVAERELSDYGYFRARMTLANGDFLEVSECFVAKTDVCSTIEYRYQWMDSSQQRLIKRWDNAEHFPDLTNFPHHIHVGDENNVIPGMLLSITELIDLLEDAVK